MANATKKSGKTATKSGLAVMFGATCERGCKAWRSVLKEQSQDAAAVPHRQRTIDREFMLAIVEGIVGYVVKYKMIVDITAKQSFGRSPGVVTVRDISDGSTGASATNYNIDADRLAEIAIGGDRCMGEDCYIGRFVARRDGRGDKQIDAAIAAITLIQAFAEGAATTFVFKWDKKLSKAVVVFGGSEWSVASVVDASLEYAEKKRPSRKPKTKDDKVVGIVMDMNRAFAEKYPLMQPSFFDCAS